MGIEFIKFFNKETKIHMVFYSLKFGLYWYIAVSISIYISTSYESYFSPSDKYKKFFLIDLGTCMGSLTLAIFFGL